jgi:hypothetical protein
METKDLCEMSESKLLALPLPLSLSLSLSLCLLCRIFVVDDFVVEDFLVEHFLVEDFLVEDFVACFIFAASKKKACGHNATAKTKDPVRPCLVNARGSNPRRGWGTAR